MSENSSKSSSSTMRCSSRIRSVSISSTDHNHHQQLLNHYHVHQNQSNQSSYKEMKGEISFKDLSVSIELPSASPSSYSQYIPTLSSIFWEKKSKLKERRQILENVSGFSRPGQLLGVMGPSGSGKTTLLNALSGRIKPDSGTISINGHPLNKGLRRKIGYVLQQDAFFPDLTLKQTLTYSALLGLPDSMKKEEKMEKVDAMVDLLDLKKCQNTIIGDIFKRGLSGGEKKRTSIASELLTNPSVMLLDEPTSGLDSNTALKIMEKLKEVARKEWKTLIVTIHQPSSQIFHLFDNLLLLSEGQVAFFGRIPSAIHFFTSTLGLSMNLHYNPADFMMEAIKSSRETRDKIVHNAKSLYKSPPSALSSNHQYHEDEVDENEMDEMEEGSSLWNNSTHHNHHHQHHHQSASHHQGEISISMDPKKPSCVFVHLPDDDSGRSSWTDRSSNADTNFSSNESTISCEEVHDSFHNNSYSSDEAKWPTSFMTQFKVLTSRNFYEARGRLLSKLKWVQTIGLALITGLMWFQVARKEERLNDIRGWLFFATSYWMLFALFGALISIPPEREVISKERASGTYRLSAYYLAKMVGELPLTLALPSIFYFISYPLFSSSILYIRDSYSISMSFLAQWFYLLLNSLVAQSVGFFIGLASTDLEISVTISALYSMSTNLFAGFYSGSMPSFLAPLRYLSIVYYAFLNMEMIEFSSGPLVECQEFNSKFESCEMRGRGEVNSTKMIPYDELIKGLDNLAGKDEYPLPIWANTIILLLFLIVFRTLGYLVLKYIRNPK